MRDWTARTQRAVRRAAPQPLGTAGFRSQADGAILSGVSRKEPERVVRKPLPMRSHGQHEDVAGRRRRRDGLDPVAALIGIRDEFLGSVLYVAALAVGTLYFKTVGSSTEAGPPSGAR